MYCRFLRSFSTWITLIAASIEWADNKGLRQSVFQILVDETRASLYQLQMVSKNLNQSEEGIETLNIVSGQLSTLMDSLQVHDGRKYKTFWAGVSFLNLQQT